jgi:dimethylhistidine N-methyltransferase
MAQPARSDPATRALRIHNLIRQETFDAFAEDVRAGLCADPKRLFPKYFYDELGSQLFEAICLLPEYYLTRAENEIFARHADAIVDACGAGTETALLELGSGSATKTRRIIEALLRRQSGLVYVPVDISTSALEESARVLLQSYPALRVDAYASDYHTALPRLRDHLPPNARALVLFLGSNSGNVDRDEALHFLRSLRRVLRVNDALLLGADLKKDPAALVAAYDDALGVTAAFNLNLLARINREFGADFRLRAFRHVAVYNSEAGRIEIYIESLRAQEVNLRALDLKVSFKAGERLHTENSYKYDAEQLARLAAESGFILARTWLDSGAQFSSNLLLADGKEGAFSK